MPVKTVIISCDDIFSLPAGRHQQGSAVVYSNKRNSYEYISTILAAIETEGSAYAAEVIKSIEREVGERLTQFGALLIEDLKSAQEVYVYVGYMEFFEATKLINYARSLGKKVYMVACDCEKARKEEFAKSTGVDVIWSSSCGAHRELRDIFLASAKK